MNAIQVTNPLCPQAYLKAAHHVKGLCPLPPVSVSYARGPLRYPTSIKLTSGRQKCPRLMPVCSSHGEARSGNGSQDPLWESFGKALENFGKKSSVEDVLRERIEEGEFYDEGGRGRIPPRGGGGGGGGGGLGGSGDEGFSGILDETIQVILATLALIFVYFYIINGAEMTLLVKDYIKFLLNGRKSARLARVLCRWEAFWKRSTAKKEVDRFWLEKAIIKTPTWWDHPEKYRHLINACSQEKPEQQIPESESSYYE